MPSPRSKKHLVIVPKSVICSQLPEGIGWLKVTTFPGAVGIDLAKALDNAFAHLRESSRLIVDLRGNTGGGIGGLRLMSYLTPGKIGSRLQSHAKTQREGIFPRGPPKVRPYTIAQIDTDLVGVAVRFHRQVHTRRHRRA